MTGRRVAISGLGVVASVGTNRRDFWHSLRDGESGIGPIEGVDLGRLSFKNGAMVRSWDTHELFDNRTIELLDRFAQFALVAAREAVGDAGIEWTDALRQRTAVLTGACVGGQTTEDEGFFALYSQEAKRLHPYSIVRIMANAAASHVAMEMGLTGPSLTVNSACSSANHAIGVALGMIRGGTADLALAGGSEAPFSLGNLKAWEAMRVVAPEACRPFSLDREGMILGEGAAILVLEPLDVAVSRGARVYAELAGVGMSSDAHHITLPSLDGPARAMQIALEDAGLARDEVDYINAHGTGTPANDVVETKAIRRVFGAAADDLLVSSTKSMHGHALGAAGALEAATTALAIRDDLAPPTANYTQPDPECDLDVVPNEARPAKIRAALSNSFAFGGMNAVLAFRRVRTDPVDSKAAQM